MPTKQQKQGAKHKGGTPGALCDNEGIREPCDADNNERCSGGRCVQDPWGGGKAKSVRKSYKGGSYVVHTGVRGGKYILVKGEKIYLTK